MSSNAARSDYDALVSDAELVRECRDGKETAWQALIERYKNLIYSIPLKLGFSADDAEEIFQSVCLSLLAELARIRDPQALPAWLMQVTAHRCSQWQRELQQFQDVDEEEMESHVDRLSVALSAEQVREVEMEQTLRQALAGLSPQCRQLIDMLFYEPTPRPYEEVAAALGLATGSIGFTRRRCLESLRKKLEGAGFAEP